jgi:chloramphenicol 3-O-phosphotransferase
MNIATEVNKEVLGEIAAESIAKINPDSANGKRWINAIAKAIAEIETNPYMTYEVDSHSLVMMSETSNAVYTANGTCQCKAFSQGFPCRHRAASRLIALYIERTR